MSDMFYTQVPYNKAHDHFTNEHIASFPDLHAEASFEDRRNFIKESIKYELLTTKPEQAKRRVILRECFKLHERSHIQFCLKNKSPGTTFVEAATELGYRKI